ncbi:MAG: glycerophosphodiester phosphodiesterase [Clostridia bacterium]|nr:glycerophosphodiester phosphodiesterase [Clostridia bacterium]
MIGLWIALGVLGGLAVLFLIYLWMIAPRAKRKRPDDTPFVGKEFAHRGLHTKDVPENSLRAFRGAVERGLGIELDIQLSKDGEVMVFHDFTLNRMTGIDGKVKDYTAAELGSMSLHGQKDGIPTLKEVLAAVDGKVPLIIEIKIPGFDLSVCPKAFEILDHYKGPYCIESFHPLAIRWMKKNRPQNLRGQLSSDFFGHKEKGSKIQFFAVKNLLLNFLARPDFIAFDIRYPKALSFRLCTKFFRALPIGWTVRTKEELEEAKKDFDGWICEDIY